VLVHHGLNIGWEGFVWQLGGGGVHLGRLPVGAYAVTGTSFLVLAAKDGSSSERKPRIYLGWATGIEPATFGATDRRSTS
jgi:hypothetical protein